MNNNFFKLLKWELVIAHKINNIIKYLFCFFLLCNFSLVLIAHHEQIKIFGMIFIIISLPLALLAFASSIFKPDYNDGNLELLLINFTPLQIVGAKYFSLLLCCFGGLLTNIPIMLIFFGISFWQMITLNITLLLILLLTSILVILIGAVQCYFQTNTNYLSILIMPLLVPSIIVSGLLLLEPQNQYFNYILLGIDLVTIPSIIYLTSYLVKNIYNI